MTLSQSVKTAAATVAVVIVNYGRQAYLKKRNTNVVIDVLLKHFLKLGKKTNSNCSWMRWLSSDVSQQSSIFASLFRRKRNRSEHWTLQMPQIKIIGPKTDVTLPLKGRIPQCRHKCRDRENTSAKLFLSVCFYTSTKIPTKYTAYFIKTLFLPSGSFLTEIQKPGSELSSIVTTTFHYLD